jgi:hypothetical protein
LKRKENSVLLFFIGIRSYDREKNKFILPNIFALRDIANISQALPCVADLFDKEVTHENLASLDQFKDSMRSIMPECQVQDWKQHRSFCAMASQYPLGKQRVFLTKYTFFTSASKQMIRASLEPSL